MTNSDRYYQPTNSKDAMRKIQKLFNSYCHAPLTNELIQYHFKLLNQVKTNVLSVAENEQIPERIKAAKSIISVMETWLKTRIAGKDFNGEMRHFKFVSNNDILRYKRHEIKVKGNNNLRSSRH
ncbi:hypothetical protein ACQW5G_02335 [Fructilactobacillus sp. Tb1]|uniref:hypothetical protein n=1 Tax=Fructilactobacillus sp. Tb1 TaxID=3422304 RepID=UPI003D2926A4